MLGGTILLGAPHMELPKINSHYLTCVGRSLGLLLNKLPSSRYEKKVERVNYQSTSVQQVRYRDIA